ncbi:MAG: PPOX class F420-dependent oxidoreductase [Minicystis sp.]
MPIPFADERYVNIESFKKDGGGVKTPVWFADLDGKLVVVTDGTSYKVKRIRRNPKVRLAACDVRGKVHGEWIDGSAVIMDDAPRAARAHQALRAKYGLQVSVLDFFSTIFGRKKRRAYLEITA